MARAATPDDESLRDFCDKGGSRMKPWISMITLGVRDLAKSARFDEQGLGLPRMNLPPEVAFFTLHGTWLGLYDREFLELPASPLTRTDPPNRAISASGCRNASGSPSRTGFPMHRTVLPRSPSCVRR